MVKVGPSTTGGIIAWSRVCQPGIRAAREGFAGVSSVFMWLATRSSIRMASALDIRALVRAMTSPWRSTQIEPSAFRAISMTRSSSRYGMIGPMANRSASSLRDSASFGVSIELLSGLWRWRRVVLRVLAEDVSEEALRTVQPLNHVGRHFLVSLRRRQPALFLLAGR